MTHESLEQATEEIEKASEVARDDEVEQRLRDRAEQLARLAERIGTDSDNAILDRHQNAVRPVSVDAGDAVDAHIVAANKQLSKFRDSIGDFYTETPP